MVNDFSRSLKGNVIPYMFNRAQLNNIDRRLASLCNKGHGKVYVCVTPLRPLKLSFEPGQVYLRQYTEEVMATSGKNGTVYHQFSIQTLLRRPVTVDGKLCGE